MYRCAFLALGINVQEKYKLNQDTSIYSAEAMAIIKALEYIEYHECQKSLILSDSLSVLTSIKSSIDINSPFCNPHILKIKSILSNLTDRDYIIKFVWVKAHIGIVNNEKVDQLAKESISSGISLYNSLCLEDVIGKCKNLLKKQWSQQWNEYCFTTPTRYTLIQQEIPKEHWYNRCNYSRKSITHISRLKFGHGCYLC